MLSVHSAPLSGAAVNTENKMKKSGYIKKLKMVNAKI